MPTDAEGLPGTQRGLAGSRWWRRWPRVIACVQRTHWVSDGDLVDEVILDALERALKRIEALEHKT